MYNLKVIKGKLSVIFASPGVFFCLTRSGGSDLISESLDGSIESRSSLNGFLKSMAIL
jgi:hypothetical protein